MELTVLSQVYAFGPIFMRPRERSSKEAPSLTDVQEAMANAKLVLDLVQCLVAFWAEVAKQVSHNTDNGPIFCL